jgi:hypothetical protein
VYAVPYENSEGSVDRSTARVMSEVTPVVKGAPRNNFSFFFVRIVVHFG